MMSCVAQAGVIVGGTRLIYEGGKKESSLSVSNPDKGPYLIQTWVETTAGGAEKAPFVVTPPLFRLDGDQKTSCAWCVPGAICPPIKNRCIG